MEAMYANARAVSKFLESAAPLCCSSKMKSAFQNWSDVRVFLAVARSGSTLAASKTLGMAQPTVARRIDALEHALGLTLFERDTRGFHPTRDAERLMEKAQAMETVAEALVRDAQAARRPDGRPIRITLPRVNFSANFAEIMADFSDANPGVSFEFISTYKLLDLSKGEADVALRITNEIDDDRLICRKLTTVTGSLYASRNYAERYGLPASENDLAAHRFVVFEYTSATQRVNNWLLERIDPSQIVTRVSHVEAMTAAVHAGLGIGPISTSLARDDETLIRCFEPPAGTDTSSWLLISPEAWRRPEVKAFAAFFAPRYKAIFRKP